MGRLDGKVALITGAASGMGKVAATLLAREGASVVVADVTDEAGQAAVKEIGGAGGSAAYFHATSPATPTPKPWSDSPSSVSAGSTSSTTTRGSSRPTTAR